MFKVFCYILFASTLFGCSATLTRVEPYSQYTRGEVTLKEDAYLRVLDETRGYNFLGIPRQLKDEERNQLLSKDKNDTSALELVPAGTQLTIERVIWTGADTPVIKAFGKIYLANKYVPFFYLWGYGNSIQRAPWESEDVPESRNVGIKGEEYSRRKTLVLF